MFSIKNVYFQISFNVYIYYKFTTHAQKKCHNCTTAGKDKRWYTSGKLKKKRQK